LPSTKIKSFKEVVEKLSENISNKSNLKIIIQPSSPLSDWSDINFRLFNFSEIVGQYFEVSTIPQIHKILDIEWILFLILILFNFWRAIVNWGV